VPVPRQRAIVLAAVKTKPSAALNRAGLDCRCARRHRDWAAGTGECSAGPNQRMWWIAICPVAGRPRWPPTACTSQFRFPHVV